MPSVTEFYNDATYEQSSEPKTPVSVQESDCWPVDDRSISGAKDQLAGGLHPVIAIGGRTAADGRPLNVTGIVYTYTGVGSGTATDRVVVDIADGVIVRQYVSNILTYSGGNPDTYETAPIVGQPVFVDDSAALSAGVTLSMSPLNSAGVKNPMAGILFYCQDEIADGFAGGARATATFDTALANEEVEQVYCVLLINNTRDLA
jgi:hypothetical protein